MNNTKYKTNKLTVSMKKIVNRIEDSTILWWCTAILALPVLIGSVYLSVMFFGRDVASIVALALCFPCIYGFVCGVNRI